MTLFSFGLGWLWSIFSSFWFWLDRSIYDLIGGLYDILISISRVSILSQGTIQEVSSRIQIFLGVFMLFKVSFSLIMYVINPDDFTDKSKGVSKLAVNTIISLVMLAVIPYIFNMAFRLQGMILDDNTLARIVFGDGKDNTQSSSEDEEGFQYSIIDGGEKIKYQIMIPFFQPDTSVRDELAVCSTLKKSNGKFNNECLKALKEFSEEEDHDYIENYRVGVEQGSFGLTFRLDTINTTVKGSNNEDYLFSYKWPITTVCGVVVCLLLISFCIDIATRAVKLSFLQLIAPVPIISYMDPKSGKEGLFGKWAKMCGTTYVSLFVRLLVLYLGIFIISNIDDLVDVVDDSKVTDPIVKVFIIIGVLFFMKQLPQILNNLGIKLDGDGKFTLNPFKKMEEGMVGGKIASRLPAAAAGAAIGLGVGAVGTATGAGAGKWFTGMASGLTGGLKGKKVGEIHKDQVAANTRMRDALRNGSTLGHRMGARFSDLIGSTGASGKLDAQDKSLEDEIKKQQEFTESFSGMKSAISSAMEGNKLGSSVPEVQARYKELKDAYEAAKIRSEGISRKEFYNEDGSFRQADYDKAVNDAASAVNDAEGALNKYLKKDGIAAYYAAYKEAIKNPNKPENKQLLDNIDGDVMRAIQKMEGQASVNGINLNETHVYDAQGKRKVGSDGKEIDSYYEALSDQTDKMSTHVNNLEDQRVKIREEREKRAADKAGIGKS